MEVTLRFGLVGGGVVPRPGVGHVELGKHVAGGQDHLGEVLGVPRAEDQTTVEGVRLEGVDDALELVVPLVRVVRLGVDVVGAEVAPLEAVDGAEVTDFAVCEAQVVEELAGAVAVPDFDAFGREGEGGGGALDEPEEFGDYGAGEDAFCG